MRWLAVAFLALLTLAACGADGEPERPEPPQRSQGVGISLSGTASMGIRG